jgi:hypothetical protein
MRPCCMPINDTEDLYLLLEAIRSFLEKYPGNEQQKAVKVFLKPLKMVLMTESLVATQYPDIYKIVSS